MSAVYKPPGPRSFIVEAQTDGDSFSSKAAFAKGQDITQVKELVEKEMRGTHCVSCVLPNQGVPGVLGKGGVTGRQIDPSVRKSRESACCVTLVSAGIQRNVHIENARDRNMDNWK